MKKLLISIICCFIIIGSASAISEEKKSEITAKRQVYTTQRRVLSNQLDNAKAEYINIAEDETLDAATKTQKLNEIENKILQINQEKARLKTKYTKDKKAIKKRRGK